MPFLALSNIYIQFDTKNFMLKSYSIDEAIPITWYIETINKHKFAKVVLDENSEMFVVYIAALEVSEPAIYPSRFLLLVVL